jgi:hypothetical protein
MKIRTITATALAATLLTNVMKRIGLIVALITAMASGAAAFDGPADFLGAVMSDLAVELLLVLVALYISPAVVAYVRGHHNRVAILVLNILMGWTVLGWIGALVWSATAVQPKVALAAAPKEAVSVVRDFGY